MTIRSILLISIAGALVAGCGGTAGASSTPAPGASSGSSPAAFGAPGAAATLPPEQKHEAGAVTIIASWIPDTSSAKVAMDTHSVDLDGFDLRQLARLRLDGGGWIGPSAWDAPKGGHHRSGTLTFGSVDPGAIASARVIELQIRDVGAAHLLRWEAER